MTEETLNTQDIQEDETLDVFDGDEFELSSPDNLKQIVEERRGVLGRRIRFERKRRKLTMRDFAALIGVTEGYAGLLERGERSPSFETFVCISHIFRANPNDLLMDAALKVSEAAPRTYGDKIDAAVSLLTGFSEAQLGDVCNILKSLHRMYLNDPKDEN